MGKRKFEKQAKLFRKFLKIYYKGQSEYCEVRSSVIHGSGVYAAKDIPKDTEIIEYAGEIITKEESARRAEVQAERAKRNGDAAVYIFDLDDEYDLDGNFPWNTARLMNHSCEPNCQAYISGYKVTVEALRNIKKGEELVYDYGFHVDTWEEHPCLCGKKSCVGYIVARAQWRKLERLKAAKKVSKVSKVKKKVAR